ncbi:MAG: nuclear transport factor 2 family protein [Deltaproteobacteria bacterium]|nr:nuclear transport factor 2 family protein [Deltaproteobacteria bacterium]
MPLAKEFSDQQNLRIVKDFFSLTESLDLDRAMGFFSENAVYHNIPLPPARGKRQVERTLRSMMQYVTGFEVQMLHIAAGDGAVLTERIDRITVGPIRIELPVSGTFEIKDGQITAWRDYFDLIQMFRLMMPSLGEVAARSLKGFLPSR